MMSMPLMLNPSSVTPKPAMSHPYGRRQGLRLIVGRFEDHHDLPEEPVRIILHLVRTNLWVPGAVLGIVLEDHVANVVHTWVGAQRAHQVELDQFLDKVNWVRLGEGR